MKISRRPRLNGHLTFPEKEMFAELEQMKNQGINVAGLKNRINMHRYEQGGLSLKAKEIIRNHFKIDI